MRSENTGKFMITDIIRKKKKTYMLLSNDEQIVINEDVVLDYYLYINKEISPSDLKRIKESVQMHDALQVAYNILSHGLYTKKEIKTKLQAKQYNLTIIEKVIKKLIDLNYLNDERFASEYVDYATSKGYGPRKIKSELIKKGINDQIINKLTLENQEEKNIELVVDKFINKQKNSNYQKKYQYLYNRLLVLGYDASLIKETLDKKLYFDEDIESSALKTDLEIAIRKYQKKYCDKELTKALYNYLMKKGYKYDTIYEVLKESDIYEN